MMMYYHIIFFLFPFADFTLSFSITPFDADAAMPLISPDAVFDAGSRLR